MGLLRCGCGAAELVEPRARRPGLAVPRHPEPNRLRAECTLPANDRERVLRPLERVVGNAHEQVRLTRRRRRAPCDDERDHDHGDGEQESSDQSPRDTSPRSDCISTRHAVAKTVRR